MQAVAEQRKKLDTEANSRIEGDVETMVSYMLFADEARIYEPMEGVSAFTKTFPERGPRDRQGRSLRDFDLQTRMFKYPLSYMIYSETFDAMPDVVREQVYRRLYDVSTDKDQSKTFARLSATTGARFSRSSSTPNRNLPDYWKAEERPRWLNLTLHTDYSLRILLYLAEHTDRPVSTREISEAYGISRNHLVRVVQTLQSHAFVKAATGRSGGITLARDPAEHQYRCRGEEDRAQFPHRGMLRPQSRIPAGFCLFVRCEASL